MSEAADAAKKIEYIQWRNSPLTKSLINNINRQVVIDSKMVRNAVFDPTISMDQVRAYIAREWMCDKVLQLIDNLLEVEQ